MSLKFAVDSIDDVPEEHRSLYTEENGKFRLNVDGYEDPTGLKSALQKERETARTASKQASAWAALGKTPEEIQELLAAQQTAEEEKLNKAGEWDKLKAQMNDQHAKAKTDWQAAMKAKDAAIEKHLIDAQAVSAITELKGSPHLLLPHVKASVKVIEENGDYAVRVVDATGNPRVNGKGEFLTVAELVGEMRQSEIYGPAFQPDGRTGGGAPPSQGKPSGGALKRSEMTAVQVREYVQDHGQQAYLKLPK